MSRPRCLAPLALLTLLALLAATSLLSACARKAPKRSLAGRYRSTWGVTQVAGEGDDVALVYPRGSMRCRVDALTLHCGWQSGEAQGKALLTRKPDGTIVGTWGRGESESDGGEWAMAPQDLRHATLKRGALSPRQQRGGSPPAAGSVRPGSVSTACEKYRAWLHAPPVETGG